MKKYSILVVTPFLSPDKGGISTYITNLSKNLFEKEHSLSFIAPKKIGAKIKEEFENVIRIDSLFLLSWPYPSLRSVSVPLSLGKLGHVVKHNDFDLIHIHGHHYPISWKAIQVANENKIPSVLTMHGMYALSSKNVGGKTYFESFLNKFFFPKIFSKTNAIIGLTNNVTEYAKKISSKSVKHYTIPSGIHTGQYRENFTKKQYFKKIFSLNQNNKIILFSGRMEPNKGIIEFVKAINQLDEPNVEYLIVGDGSMKEKVHALSEKNSKIHLFPWQNENEIYKFYLASDIFILPSKFEALPLTILEAMNASLHIVSTRVGGIEEILKPYNAKTYLENVSPNEIAKVLRDVIRNTKTADEPSINYAQGFDWKIISERILKVYEEITAS